MGHRIKIGVGGRFHADRLAAALSSRGWEVTVVTSLPRNRFKTLPPKSVESHVFPEVVYRMGAKIAPAWGSDFKMKTFGKAFSRSCKRDAPIDVILAWSGFAVEAFKSNPRSFKVLVRDSLHILDQVEILENEYNALGIKFPNHKNTIKRELEEYALADKTVILSKVAKESFLKRGISESKLSTVRLGADLEVFSSTQREKRANSPLQVVYFGTLSIRKGVVYLLEAMENFSSAEVQLTCIGAVERGFEKILNRYDKVRICSPVGHSELARRLREFDVFVMPTLEDGFGLVVPQAMAAGLVPIVSKAAGASELILDGKTGIVIPPRDSASITKSIQSLLSNPSLMDDLRANILQNKSILSWENYGDDFDTILKTGLISPGR